MLMCGHARGLTHSLEHQHKNPSFCQLNADYLSARTFVGMYCHDNSTNPTHKQSVRQPRSACTEDVDTSRLQKHAASCCLQLRPSDCWLHTHFQCRVPTGAWALIYKSCKPTTRPPILSTNCTYYLPLTARTAGDPAQTSLHMEHSCTPPLHKSTDNTQCTPSAHAH